MSTTDTVQNTTPLPDLTDPDSILQWIVTGFVRHLATLLAGFLLTHGLAASSDGEILTGALVALGMFGWSAIEKIIKSEGHRLALLATDAGSKAAAQLAAAKQSTAANSSPVQTAPTVAVPSAAATNGLKAHIHAGPLAALALCCAFAFLGTVYFTGCGTTAGVNTANFLESPANQAIVNIAVQAGVNSLLASTGKNIPEEAREPLTAAASAAATSLSSGVIYAAAEALRTKQGTMQSAAPAALAHAANIQAGTPADVSPIIGSAVQSLAAQGVAPDAANEAVASALDAAAAAASKAGK